MNFRIRFLLSICGISLSCMLTGCLGMSQLRETNALQEREIIDLKSQLDDLQKRYASLRTEKERETLSLRNRIQDLSAKQVPVSANPYTIGQTTGSEMSDLQRLQEAERRSFLARKKADEEVAALHSEIAAADSLATAEPAPTSLPATSLFASPVERPAAAPTPLANPAPKPGILDNVVYNLPETVPTPMPTPALSAAPTPAPTPSAAMAAPTPSASAAPPAIPLKPDLRPTPALRAGIDLRTVNEELTRILADPISKGQVLIETASDRVTVVIWNRLVFSPEGKVSPGIHRCLSAVGNVFAQKTDPRTLVEVHASAVGMQESTQLQAEMVKAFLSEQTALVGGRIAAGGRGAAIARFPADSPEAAQNLNSRTEISLR